VSPPEGATPSETVPAAQAGPADWTDRVLELDVGPVAHGGHCVARAPGGGDSAGAARTEGRVVFVRHALPGERVLAVVTEDQAARSAARRRETSGSDEGRPGGGARGGGGGFCRADAIAVLEPAPQRVTAPCVWARPGGCGGCDFQHVEPGAQRRLKATVLAEQLRHLAGVERDVVVEELPGGPLGWRHRVRLAVDAEGRPGLRAHRSHDVLPIADCPLVPVGVLPPVLARAFAPGVAVEVVLDAEAVVHVTPEQDASAPPDRARRRNRSDASIDRDVSADRERVVHHAAGREWRLSPGVFWQVHPALPDALADVVGEWADAPAGGTAWDLYGGVGLFAAVLAGQVGRAGAVHVVESSRRAVADGRAALADLPQVTWAAARVEKVLGRLPGRTTLTGPDVVVVDPPRRGLGRELVDALCARAPGRVVHVACDPAALARDVGLFAERGYPLAGLRAFDAFPMTHHLESVALLVRS